MNLTEEIPGGTLAPLTSAPPGPSPDDPRVVLVLEEYSAALKAGKKPDRHEFEGRYPEIGATLGISASAVGEFLRRAVARLRKAASE